MYGRSHDPFPLDGEDTTRNPALRRFNDLVLTRMLQPDIAVDDAVPAQDYLAVPAATSEQAAAQAAFAVRFLPLRAPHSLLPSPVSVQR
jgi:hypothetical protein